MKPNSEQIQHFQELGVHLRVNCNRRCLVSLRDQRRGPPVLSVHQALLTDERAMADIERFARDRGGGRYPHMQLAMQVIIDGHRRASSPPTDERLLNLERIGTAFDFEACFRRIHARYYPTLSRPFFRWARDSGQRRLRSIRFGSYVYQPHPAVRLNPRLDQPWVALCFVEHVIHHELAHHLQACDPRPREAQHSKRFRAIERSFPDYAIAMAWEAANIQRLLAAPAEALLMGDPLAFASDNIAV